MAIRRLAPVDLSPGDWHAERRIREQFERALSSEEATGRRFSSGALLIGLGVISIWLFGRAPAGEEPQALAARVEDRLDRTGESQLERSVPRDRRLTSFKPIRRPFRHHRA
jgi:hypothetical protein